MRGEEESRNHPIQAKDSPVVKRIDKAPPPRKSPVLSPLHTPLLRPRQNAVSTTKSKPPTRSMTPANAPGNG